MRTARSRPRRVLGLVVRGLFLLTLALLALAAIRWQATLNWLGNYLICSDPLEPADLILVMGGDFWGPRVSKAAQLGAQGLAPLVLISGPPYAGRPEGELAIEFLVQQGYPKDKFAVFAHHEPSTLGEVRVLASELARRGVKRVIVVTSSYQLQTLRASVPLILPRDSFHLRASSGFALPRRRLVERSRFARTLLVRMEQDFGIAADRLSVLQDQPLELVNRGHASN